MCRLLVGYSELYEPSNYEEPLVDPVKRFLSVMLINDETADINYLTRLFYSVKGTIQVLNYLKKYLGLEMSYTYETTCLKLNVERIELDIVDEGTLRVLFTDFLKTLLFFKELDLSVSLVEMHLKSNLPNYVAIDSMLVNIIDV